MPWKESAASRASGKVVSFRVVVFLGRLLGVRASLAILGYFMSALQAENKAIRST